MRINQNAHKIIFKNYSNVFYFVPLLHQHMKVFLLCIMSLLTILSALSFITVIMIERFYKEGILGMGMGKGWGLTYLYI